MLNFRRSAISKCLSVSFPLRLEKTKPPALNIRSQWAEDGRAVLCLTNRFLKFGCMSCTLVVSQRYLVIRLEIFTCPGALFLFETVEKNFSYLLLTALVELEPATGSSTEGWTLVVISSVKAFSNMERASILSSSSTQSNLNSETRKALILYSVWRKYWSNLKLKSCCVF